MDNIIHLRKRVVAIRLWHYELIPYLPQKQLIAQWRECCCIAKNIAINGTPNHLLVNKVLNYPSIHFIYYTNLILEEMKNRGYKINEKSYISFCNNMTIGQCWFKHTNDIIKNKDDLFPHWHTTRYLKQCIYNLQEKADCGGIPISNWEKINRDILENI